MTKSVGDAVSVRGIIVACDSNTDSYGAIISVKKLEKLKSPNEEILHWTTSMILSEEEYEQKLSTPSHIDISHPGNIQSIGIKYTNV